MSKLIGLLLTLVSIILFIVGIGLLYSTGINIYDAMKGAQLDLIKMVILPVLISAAFIYSAKKLFINSFYQVIRK